MNNQNLERDLERIIIKWTTKIEYPPAWVEKRCQESTKPIVLFLSMLVQKCIQHKVVVKSPSEGWVEYHGGMLANFSGTLVMLGLEFHSKDPVKNNDIEGMISLFKSARSLLDKSSKQILENFKVLLLGLVVKNVVDEETMSSLSEKFGKLLLYCKVECFKAGVQLGNDFR